VTWPQTIVIAAPLWLLVFVGSSIAERLKGRE
jgi:hypothetical protein